MSDAIERLTEVGAAAMYGKNWNGPDDKRPGDKMKEVWRNYVRAAIPALLAEMHLSPDAAAGLSDGNWVAVPREPDDAMLIAAGKMLMDNPDASRKQVWDAMISAYDPAAASQQNGEK